MGIIFCLLSLRLLIHPLKVDAEPTKISTGTSVQSENQAPPQPQPTPIPVKTTQHQLSSGPAISAESLEQYLQSKHSPLAPYSNTILQSRYWSTIIAICTIEEYSCSHNPFGSNNLWGIGGEAHLARYPSLEAGIAAIDALLTRYEARGLNTIEKTRPVYCQSACTAWLGTVIKTKLKLESL